MKKQAWLIALAMILYVIVTMSSSYVSFFSRKEKKEFIPEVAVPWNLREMKKAEGKPAQKTMDVYRNLAVISEDELPKGIRIDWARVDGNNILIVFERYRYLNSNLDRDYIAVFDTQGRYQYGFEGKLIINGENEIAFSQDRNGIMIRNWRFSSISESTYLLIRPDGTALPLETIDYWGIDPETAAYWDSDYDVMDTANCRLVIRNGVTGEERIVFDYTDEYIAMYPNSSKIDEDSERLFNVLFPLFFIVVSAVFVLPRMVDNPDVPKRGIKESYGDLRDRWR